MVGSGGIGMVGGIIWAEVRAKDCVGGSGSPRRNRTRGNKTDGLRWSVLWVMVPWLGAA
jgi:hypothetical protein